MRHLPNNEQVNVVRTLLSQNRPLLLQGVSVDQPLADFILSWPVFAGSIVQIPIFLSGAEVSARLPLDGYHFASHFDTTGAIFQERATLALKRCVFDQSCSLQFTFFNAAPPHLTETEFRGSVDMSFAHGDRVSIGLSHCTFANRFSADGIVGAILLNKCRFRTDLFLKDADSAMIVAEDCEVGREIDVSGTRCAAMRMPYLRALTALQFGPIFAKNDVTLSRARFNARVRLEVNANRLDLRGAQLPEGGHILAERARLDLAYLSAARSLRISAPTDSKEKTSVSGLQDADAGSMTFASMDMRHCLFYGAHDLERVTLETTVELPWTPRWCARRRCVADEFVWRRRVGGLRALGWKLPDSSSPSQRQRESAHPAAHDAPQLRASQVAAVYRSLRRSFEQRSDQPGAADFYYGEMEMRRHSTESGWAERTIIWLYWAFSGYGLRASRSFAWLFALLVASAFVMAHNGFVEGQRSVEMGLVFAFKAALPGGSGVEKLTLAGEIVTICLRLFGPLFLALGLLALRNRVKRE